MKYRELLWNFQLSKIVFFYCYLQVCTYENWPKSFKCAMCATVPNNSQRSQASSLIVPSPEKELELSTHESRTTIESSISLLPANNYDNDRKLRQLRRQADWNWLNACIGVIEGDPNPVEAYLASGGEPTRTLTAAEVAMLNRASAFDVGHTLVHLAIRCV